jgi:hypothetical protein
MWSDLVRLRPTGQNEPQHPEALGWCHGYARGALDHHRAASPANAAPLFCAPTPSPSSDEVRQRFIAWGKANAPRAAGPAVEGVVRLLIDSFPCPHGLLFDDHKHGLKPRETLTQFDDGDVGGRRRGWSDDTVMHAVSLLER